MYFLWRCSFHISLSKFISFLVEIAAMHGFWLREIGRFLFSVEFRSGEFSVEEGPLEVVYCSG